MDAGWRDHLDALGRFNEWETAHPRPQGDITQALAWLSEALDFARHVGGAFDPARSRSDHGERLRALHLALTRAALRP